MPKSHLVSAGGDVTVTARATPADTGTIEVDDVISDPKNRAATTAVPGWSQSSLSVDGDEIDGEEEEEEDDDDEDQYEDVSESEDESEEEEDEDYAYWSSQSLSSSIHEYVYENGRRYHRIADGKYYLPDDEIEQERQTLHHHALLLLLKGKLFLAPIKEKPEKILDVGTGTGLWVMDTAETYPDAEVIGFDLSPIQPTWVYPNCCFEVDDAEMEWCYPKEHFDYIHLRFLMQSIRDWPSLISQMYSHTKRGGWSEIVEGDISKIYCDDDTLPDGSMLQYLMELQSEAYQKIGVQVASAEDLKRWMEEIGFVDVRVEFFKQPTNSWPKEEEMKQAGQCIALFGEEGIVSYLLGILTRILDFEPKTARMMCQQGARELQDPGIHAYCLLYHVYGRRPEKDEVVGEGDKGNGKETGKGKERETIKEEKKGKRISASSAPASKGKGKEKGKTKKKD